MIEHAHILVAVIAGAAIAWTLFAALCQIASFSALASLLARRVPPPPVPRPRCTFLRPLRGNDDSKEANLDDLCRFGLPIVAGVVSPQDPAVGLVRRVQSRHPDLPISLRVGRGPAGANRKVSNLIQMLPASHGEFLIFTDADVRLHPSSLDTILALFRDPRVGLVTCPYRAVAGNTLRERLDVIYNNTAFLPAVALAERVEGVRFALGACIALRRDVLEEIGGLRFLLDMLPDDYALASAVRAAGHRIALAPVLLDHCVAPRNWRALARRHMRWARTVRCVRPWGHLATVTTHGLPPALVAAGLGGGLGLSAAGIWLAIRLCLPFLMRRRLGLGPRDLLLLPAVDLWSFLILAGSQVGGTVWWDDRLLEIEPGGRISAVYSRTPVPEERIPQPAWPAPKRKRAATLS